MKKIRKPDVRVLRVVVVVGLAWPSVAWTT